MQSIEQLHSFDQIKILADPRRLTILRRLMAGPATLTQLGQMMGEHPAWVRHHLKQLEQAGLIELVSTQMGAGFVEKFYQARAKAFILQQTILPDLTRANTLILLGSHDIALSMLAGTLVEHADLELLVLPVGSLDGLIALRQGVAHLTSCHLLDIDSGEYNLPYVRHLFPERPMKLVTLAHREQGLMLAPGNPRHIQGIADLGRGDVSFINRNAGSGTRLWLDKQLGRLGISGERIHGYNLVAHTHTAVAQAVAEGRADTALGLAAAAHQYNLDFIPLFQERFDLVLPAESLGEPGPRRLMDALHGGEFRHLTETLGGYSTAHTGEEITT